MAAIVYDTETFPNCFLLGARGWETDDSAMFEISERRNDLGPMLEWLHYLAKHGVEMIGYNNVAFDYQLIHAIMSDPLTATAEKLYAVAMNIINSQDRFANTVRDYDRYIPQIDLLKIHHFDNKARMTSLKSLQINMRSPSVEDLPFPVGTFLTFDQIDVLRGYCDHDITETKKFGQKSKSEIEFRRALSAKYGRDFMNHNDTAIGKAYFIMRLEEAKPGACYQKGADGRRRPVQTIRHQIKLADVILPYVRFSHPEFARILDWLKAQTIIVTKGAFEDVSCTVNGFKFDFGTGGIHGSVTKQTIRSDEEFLITDLDVTSYYPSIAIANRLAPAHLGDLFCDIYADVMAQRLGFKKGTPEYAMLKLALNGVYGDSNNAYSPFYDSQYTMAITVNGQLLLCMLAESLMATVPRLQMVQINTDGMTIRAPRSAQLQIDAACKYWQEMTRLKLESANYDFMYIRDVNNYIAVKPSGDIKRKGAYDSRPAGTRIDAPAMGWHQDTSALVVPMAAEAYLTKGVPIELFIAGHRDPFDFMLKAKVPRDSQLMHGDVQIQGTSRYYLANEGAPLVKQSPPVAGAIIGYYKPAQKTSYWDWKRWHDQNGNVWNPEIHTKAKSVYEIRKMQICAGWNVAICNRAEDFRWENLNYSWYIAEAKKLLE